MLLPDDPIHLFTLTLKTTEYLNRDLRCAQGFLSGVISGSISFYKDSFDTTSSLFRIPGRAIVHCHLDTAAPSPPLPAPGKLAS